MPKKKPPVHYYTEPERQPPLHAFEYDGKNYNKWKCKRCGFILGTGGGSMPACPEIILDKTSSPCIVAYANE